MASAKGLLSHGSAKATVVFVVKYLGQCGCGCGEDISLKVELKETQTLDDLLIAIISDWFEWYDPHLYSFFFDNVPYSRNIKMTYTCKENLSDPFDIFAEKPNSTKTKLKDLTLQKNQKFLLVFDFGDDHFFRIKVANFATLKKGEKYPLILQKKGTPPQQYYYPEDEDQPE